MALDRDTLLERLAADDHGRIGIDLPCCRCYYNLRGLAPEGDCPECGRSIEQSIGRAWVILGDRRWLRRIARGATWFIVSLAIVALVMLVTGLSDFVSQKISDLRWIYAGCAVASTVGLWMMTTVEPSRRDRRVLTNRRRLARTAIVVVGFFVLLTVNASSYVIRTMGFNALFVAVYPGAVLLIYLYAYELARGMSNRPLIRRTKFVIVVLVLLLVSLLVFDGLNHAANAMWHGAMINFGSLRWRPMPIYMVFRFLALAISLGLTITLGYALFLSARYWHALHKLVRGLPRLH